MAAPGCVRVHRGDTTITFQVEGWATMRHALPLRRAAELALAQGVTAVRVDLGPCGYMDSTFLGTLLFLVRGTKRCGASFALAAVSPACQTLLHQMGLTDAYPVAAEPLPAGASWSELSCGQEDAEAFNRNVARAHQELASLPGAPGAAFQRVADCLAKEAPPDLDETIEITPQRKKAK